MKLTIKNIEKVCFTTMKKEELENWYNFIIKHIQSLTFEERKAFWVEYFYVWGHLQFCRGVEVHN